jgi:hypothetical protein
MASMVASNMLTRVDLDALPDDGLRHELIDGQFVMTPVLGFDHQVMADEVRRLLWGALRGTGLTVLSAATKHVDTGRKREVYDEAGVGYCRLIDPDGPSITILALADGGYAHVGHVSGGDTFSFEQSVVLTLCPTELLAD